MINQHIYTPDRIAEIRADLGESQPQFAMRLGVDACTVSRWERGVAAPRGAAIGRALEAAARAAKKVG